MVLKRLIVFILVSGYTLQLFSLSNRLTAEVNALGCIEFFYLNSGDDLFYKKQNTPGGNWSEDQFIASFVYSAKLIKDRNNCLRLYYIDHNDDLYCIMQELPDYEWTNETLIGEEIRCVDVICDNEGWINLFYISSDDRLIRRYQFSDDLWSADNEMTDFAGMLASGVNEDGRLELFYTIEDSTMYHMYQLSAGGSWSDGNYFSIQAKDISVARNEDGRMEVFFVSTTNTLYHKYQVAINSGWSDHFIFKENVQSVVTTNNHDGRIEVLYKGSGNYLYHNWQIETNGSWGSGEQFGWQVNGITAALNEDGRLEVFYLGENDVLFHNWQLQPGLFWAGEYPFVNEDEPLFSYDDFNTVSNYLPNPGWHVNDHCFITDEENDWHMFGIVYPDPFSGDDSFVNYFGHAGAETFSQSSWTEMDPPFYETMGDGDVLWAPHVIQHDGTYFMFYCGGGEFDAYEICLRTSTDLVTWSDYLVLFADGIQGRDPMVMWLEEEQCWIMYYTATSVSSGGYFVVAYRTSEDLYNWSERNIAYYDYHRGTSYGNTESPYVVNRGDYYYLFVGPRPYDLPTEDLENWEHPGYVGTDVFRSKSWDHWNNADFAGHIKAHAPEIIQDINGDWFISHAGVLQGGLFITPLYWMDGINTGSSERELFNTFFLLHSCMPNPFQSETKIHYSLFQKCHVRIEIIDVLGRNITMLTNENKAEGDYSIRWDGKDNYGTIVPRGIYICRLMAGHHQDLKKIIFTGNQ